MIKQAVVCVWRIVYEGFQGTIMIWNYFKGTLNITKLNACFLVEMKSQVDKNNLFKWCTEIIFFNKTKIKVFN